MSMDTYPLDSLSIEEAMHRQFKLVDVMTRHFRGEELLSLGDLGVVKGINKPRFTKKIEETLADFFGTEKAMLVRGAGTGALRFGFMSFLKPGDEILVHDAPIYPTSKTTLESMGILPIYADFHDSEQIKEAILKHPKLKGVLIQHTRQKIDDHYDLAETIKKIRSIYSDLVIITDDNYLCDESRKDWSATQSRFVHLFIVQAIRSGRYWSHFRKKKFNRKNRKNKLFRRKPSSRL
nr:aminotransferase class I/II-fold pyridoxal phosphate-dependent enzyme [Bacillus licheniformis]